MRTEVKLDSWARKEHYLFFSKFEEPFFGLTVTVDCTNAYQVAKQKGQSFFLYYLYRSLKAANEIENFRYRIIGDQVYVFDNLIASPTISRPDGTFGFAYMNFHKDESIFLNESLKEIEQVKNSNSLVPGGPTENVIHFSAIPWLNFTSLSHARRFSFPDSCPKISFGKVTEKDNRKSMPVSIHAHHGLMDGYQVGLFVDRFQQLMDE